VNALAAGVVWQLAQVVAPVWFMVAGVQTVPGVWHNPQVLAVIGVVRWALVPVVGRGVAEVPLWQPETVQSVVAPSALWL
jgi:hypothetical protein